MDFTIKKHLQAINSDFVNVVHKTQDSKHQSCYCILISPPMTVVKPSPFSLVSKLGYVRNYAVSMMCFTLLLVCPEVSYSFKHNHFFQALHWSRNKIEVHSEYVCSFQLLISYFFCFLTLFLKAWESSWALCLLYCFSYCMFFILCLNILDHLLLS